MTDKSNTQAADCQHCHGAGEVFGHAANCTDDLCALNGDAHSCQGHIEPCSCAQPTPEPVAFNGLTEAETSATASVMGLASSAEPVAQADGVPLAWQSTREGLLAYVLQDDLHNRLTPRVIDIAYTAFMSGASGKNKDDGGPCDWFNDTRPVVREAIEKVRKDLSEAAAAPSPVALQGRDDESRRDTRQRLWDIGRQLDCDELDSNQLSAIGNELMVLSNVCGACRGEGIDGDPPDCNGDGGWTGKCAKCNGTGRTGAARASLPAGGVVGAAAPSVRPSIDEDTELLPCPFCGSDNVSLSQGSSANGAPWFYIECEDCSACAETNQWNKRTIPPLAQHADVLERCAQWCQEQATSDWYGRTAADMVRAYAAATPQPSETQGRRQMTDEQIRSLCKQSWVFETVKQWVRITEAHHGIPASPQDGGGQA